MATAASVFTTFRDPAGTLRVEGERVLRTVHPEYAASTEAFLDSAVARELFSSGALVGTQRLGYRADGALELEHSRIFFPSYAWEWSAAQYSDAALLTLDLCDKLLDHGFILKDATPQNILFSGSQPVLVDLLSVEKRDPLSPMWNAYSQFVRTFLLPLLAHRYLGWPLAASRFRRDGFEPQDIYPHLSFFRRWIGVARGSITLPLFFDRWSKGGKTPMAFRFSADTCTEILHARFRSLRKAIQSLEPGKLRSHWLGYTSHCDHYSLAARIRKEEFVTQALKTARPATVLDVGANTGVFSRLAAESGARVVALDIDGASTDRHYRSAHKAGLSILPLHADIARPTPSAGWRNLESLSLLDRCRRRFECVFLLGLLHHLLVSDQIPLAEIAALIAELAPRWIVAEWIPPTDPKFVEICRGRDARYAQLNEDAFHLAIAPSYRVAQREVLDNGRVLMLMQAR